MSTELLLGLLGVGATLFASFVTYHIFWVGRKDRANKAEKAIIQKDIQTVAESLSKEMEMLVKEVETLGQHVDKHVESFGSSGRDFNRRVQLLERESVNEAKVRMLLEDKLQPIEKSLEDIRKGLEEDIHEVKDDVRSIGSKIDGMGKFLAEMQGYIQARRKEDKEDF